MTQWAMGGLPPSTETPPPSYRASFVDDAAGNVGVDARDPVLDGEAREHRFPALVRAKANEKVRSIVLTFHDCGRDHGGIAWRGYSSR